MTISLSPIFGTIDNTLISDHPLFRHRNLGNMARSREIVERLVRVPLSARQYSALVSLVMDAGEILFRESELFKRVNEGAYARIPDLIRDFSFDPVEPFVGKMRYQPRPRRPRWMRRRMERTAKLFEYHE